MTVLANTPIQPQRLHAIDTAKGIGIIFVVFGHAWRGAFDAGLLPDEALYHVIDNMIYAWHMPLFFFLSGLMFLTAVARTTPVLFVKLRVWRLLWPLALWTWVFFGVKLIAGQAANYPVTASEFPLWPLPPYEHLWFLWALFLVQLVALPLCLALRSFVSLPVTCLVLAAMAVLIALLMPVLYVPSAYFGAAVEHSPYLLAGVAMGFVAHKRPPLWVASCAALGFLVILFGTTQVWATVFQSLDLVVLFWLVIAFADRNDPNAGGLLRALRMLGQASLAIFLAHTIFSAAFRTGLMSVDVTALWVHLVVATCVGLAGPVVMLWITDRLRLTQILGLSRG